MNINILNNLKYHMEKISILIKYKNLVINVHFMFK